MSLSDPETWSLAYMGYEKSSHCPLRLQNNSDLQRFYWLVDSNLYQLNKDEEIVNVPRMGHQGGTTPHDIFQRTSRVCGKRVYLCRYQSQSAGPGMSYTVQTCKVSLLQKFKFVFVRGLNISSTQVQIPLELFYADKVLGSCRLSCVYRHHRTRCNR